MTIASIVLMGYTIDVNHVTTLGYETGAAPPPPPPAPSTVSRYGPALWDYGGYDERKRRKKDLERQKRLEMGIIKELVVPKELRPEVKEVIKQQVIVALDVPRRPEDSKIIERVARQVAEELVLELRNSRLLERLKKLEEDEEEEAIEAMTLWMMN